MREADGIADVETRLGNVRALARTEISVKRIAMIGDVSCANHRACNMRSSERAASRLGENILDAHGDAGDGESFHDRVAAIDALALKAFEARPDRVCVAYVQREQMNFEVTVVRTEHAAAHGSYPEAGAGGESLVVASDGVVIGDRDR